MKKNLLISLIVLLGLLSVFFFFIPAFQGKISINPIIDLGFLQFRWYGLIMALAILVGFFLARTYSWRFGISKQAVDDYSFWLIILSFIGARIYYVIFNYGLFENNLTEIYKVWHGGLSIYGAIITGILFTFFYSRNKAHTFYQLFDLVALSLPLAQAVGRFGNFMNQEAFGTPTNLPWKMYVDPQFRPIKYLSYNFFHPAFLYEAIIDVIVFLILRKLVGKVKSGVIGLTYLALYSLGRFFVEGMRIDSSFIYGFRIDQIVAFLMVGFAGYMIILKQKTIDLKAKS